MRAQRKAAMQNVSEHATCFAAIPPVIAFDAVRYRRRQKMYPGARQTLLNKNHSNSQCDDPYEGK
jgi:hypothetical protein